MSKNKPNAMKILKILTLGFIISILFLNIACNKNDECDVITQAPQEFLDYWFFPVGSWWVYRNQDGEIDTVTCTIRESNFYTPEDAYGLIPCLYYYRCFYDHSNKKYFPDVGMKNKHSIEGLSSNNGIFWNLLASNYGSYYYFQYFFKYPYNIGDTVNYKVISNKVRLTTILDTNSLQIDSHQFYNVVNINYFHEGDKPDLLYENIWLANEVGIVKISYYSGEYWELIDYKINK